MSMRFRRGAIRARDIDGEPAAVKLQVRIRGFVSVVPAVPRLKTRPRSSAVLSTAIFFAIDEPWTPRERTRCITNVPSIHLSGWKISKHRATHTPSATSIRFLQRILYFSIRYISLILWFFFALEFISINLNSSFIFFSNYSDGIWSSGEKRASEWFVEKRKEEATSRFPTSSVYRYKFLFFGTEVCQPAPFGYCYYNRATEKSKDLPLRKFVPRSRFFKIWDGMFKIGKEFFDRSANDTFFTRNILEIPIHLPNATYRSLSSQIRLPPSTTQNA